MPLMDMFTSTTFSYMKSAIYSAEKKRQRRLKDAKLLRIKGAEHGVKDKGYLAPEDPQRSGEPFAFRRQSAASQVALDDELRSDRSTRTSSIRSLTSGDQLERRDVSGAHKRRQRVPYDFYYMAKGQPEFYILLSPCPGRPLYEAGYDVEVLCFTEHRLHEFIRNGFRMELFADFKPAYIEEVTEVPS